MCSFLRCEPLSAGVFVRVSGGETEKALALCIGVSLLTCPGPEDPCFPPWA